MSKSFKDEAMNFSNLGMSFTFGPFSEQKAFVTCVSKSCSYPFLHYGFNFAVFHCAVVHQNLLKLSFCFEKSKPTKFSRKFNVTTTSCFHKCL